MNKEEMICKNCKYHYIEEISFDYPQSCCNKRKEVIEEWFNCNDFEYSDKYIEQLQQENKKYKEVIFKIKMIISARIKEYQKKIDNEIDMGSQGDHFKICRYEENIKFLKDILKEVE